MFMINRKADAAPAVPVPAEVADDERRRLQEEQDRKVKPVQAPPPAPGMALRDQEDAARARNPQAEAWLSAPAVWFTAVESAADTKAAVLDDIAQAVIGRFNADTALAAGRAVTRAWIDGQILTYQLPITDDDVRQAVVSALGTAGIQVQE